MVTQKEIAARSEGIRRQLEVKLGVKGRDLGDALRRAVPLLPRRVRTQAAVLARAEKMAGNPKLARMQDAAAVTAAHDAVAAHLRAIDVAEARRGRLLSLAAAVAFNLLCVMVAFVVWLWWRGYV